MNRTVMRRSVTLLWSLFLRELSVDQVLSISICGEGMTAGYGL